MNFGKRDWKGLFWKVIWKLARRYLDKGYGQLRYQPLFEEIYRYSLGGMNIGAGGAANESGEVAVIEYVAQLFSSPASGPIIFDVGANQGQYAEQVLKVVGNKARLHCFEPSQTTFAHLLQRLGSYPNVTLYNVGLGEAQENCTLFTGASDSGLASLYRRRLDHFGISLDAEEQVFLKTLDGFCEENAIKTIHLLKLDVEGHELGVLRGAQKLIKAGAIKIIQFEFGGCNIDSHTFFQDFFYLLNPHYTLHRVVQDGWVVLPTYQEHYELFFTTNFLAVSRSVNAKEV
jgi:FkbM family methyltransferase